MASTINSTTTGVKITSDATGALDIQTNGANAIQIGTGQTATISNVVVTSLTATSLTVSAPQVFPAGSASAPAVTTTGDTNTGVYFPAADQVAVTTGGTVAAAFNSNGLFFRNRIINGDMRIAQRGTAAVTADGSFPVDRFKVSQSTDGAFSAQQDTSVPAGFVNSFKITTTTADATLTTTQNLNLSQSIEGTNIGDLAWGTANARTVTLSFWVRSSLTGTFGGSLRNGALDRSYAFTYSISVADTWEYKTVTIPGDTSGTWLNTTGIGVNVVFGLGAGPDRSGAAGAWAAANYVSATGAVSVIGTLNATWYITGVQLETGSVATPFERRPFGTELMLCQRYYYRNTPGAINKAITDSAYIISTTQAIGVVKFPVLMRVAPSALEQSGTAADYAIFAAGAATNCSAIPSFNSATNANGLILATVASGLTNGNGGLIGTGSGSGASAYLGWSAEL